MTEFSQTLQKIEGQETEWYKERKIERNKGCYKITQEFEVILQHEELKQIIQNFFEEINTKLWEIEVLYEYYKATAKTTDKFKVKLVFVASGEYNEIKQHLEQLHFSIKTKSKLFKVLYEYYKKILGG